ncbi:MAG: phosphoglucomutase/phosphomannomutase family protein [Elusimicrobiota bacterium]
MAIEFGTSGWRAVLSEDFTFDNVRKLIHAISGHIKEHPLYGYHGQEYFAHVGEKAAKDAPLVVIGYDPRFMGEKFALEAAEVFAAAGVRVILSDQDTPTPAVAWNVLEEGAVGGIVVTASHNPGNYNGIKWTPFWGGPATVDVTEDIERRISIVGHHNIRMMAYDKAERDGWITRKDFRGGYFKQLRKMLDIDKIKAAKLRIGVDAMNGAARHYLRPFLESIGLTVEAINEERDVTFQGHSPEPTPERLERLAALMKKKNLQLGLACDGDADRFGVLDEGGAWISANEVLALTLHHLITYRRQTGGVARSLMTSHFVDAVAKSRQLRVRETPVGFKHIGELLRTGDFILGGEESGGLSIRGHVPEKDGILACLLMAELTAYAKKPLAKVRDSLFKDLGHFCNSRLNFELSSPKMAKELRDRLTQKPPLNIAGTSVWRIDHTDGFKFILKDGRWMGLRLSGTEPVVRLYAEAFDPKGLKSLVDDGRKIIMGKK